MWAGARLGESGDEISAKYRLDPEDFNRLWQIAQSMIDLVTNLFAFYAFTPRYMMKTFLEVMLQSAQIFQEITPDSDSRIAVKEFRNKLQAFHLFEHVDQMLGLSPDANLTLGEMVRKASALGPFFSVWATEGLGRYYAHLRARDGKFPDNLLWR